MGYGGGGEGNPGVCSVPSWIFGRTSKLEAERDMLNVNTKKIRRIKNSSSSILNVVGKSVKIALNSLNVSL
jgi:hypothetical protein